MSAKRTYPSLCDPIASSSHLFACCNCLILELLGVERSTRVVRLNSFVPRYNLPRDLRPQWSRSGLLASILGTKLFHLLYQVLPSQAASTGLICADNWAATCSFLAQTLHDGVNIQWGQYAHSGAQVASGHEGQRFAHLKMFSPTSFLICSSVAPRLMTASMSLG